MLEEPLHPRVIELGEEVADISVEYPVHLSLGDPDRERIQRIVRATPGPEPVGETAEVLLVHGVQHLHHRTLEDLVLQGGDAERALPPVRLRYVHPARRARPVGTAVDTAEQVFEVPSQVLPVSAPRHLVDTRGCLRVDRHVGRPQASQVDVVQQCGEPCVLIPSCYLSHTVQPAWHTWPGPEPGACRTARAPLGQPPSLHHHRSRFPGVVRRLRRYYEVV
jgi:hypothetical protein